MQLTGLLHGAPLLRHVDFPVTEVLGPAATEAEIQNLIDRHKIIFIKPVFKGGVGKKGKAGLIGNASDLRTALAEKERLFSSSIATAMPPPKPTASPSKAASRRSTKSTSRSRIPPPSAPPP